MKKKKISSISDLINTIKDSKKYKDISDSIVEKETHEYLKKHNLQPISVTPMDIKEIRSLLHRRYASYQTNKKKKFPKLLKELSSHIKDDINLSPITNQLLSMVVSTKERLPFYEDIYQRIFKYTGTPKKINDLGSGLNVLSFPLMNITKLEYNSYDISVADIELLNEYLSIMKKKGLSGSAKIIDTTDLGQIEGLPKADITFMFKLIDLIDDKKEKFSEKIISLLFAKNLTKHVVASFPTRTLTRKKMNLPERRGFELMLNRINLTYRTIGTDNEIFYVISRQ